MSSLIHIDDPCVLFALRRESAPFLRLFPVQQRFPEAPCRARFCGPAWLSVLVVETGVGRGAAERALEWLAAAPRLDGVPYRPRLVIGAGFCGGLDPELKVGDVVLAEEVLAGTGTVHFPTWPPAWPDGNWEPPLHRVRLATVDGIAATAAAKAALRASTAAGAVDMESSAIAAACARAGLPWAILRAVSDDAATSLSPRLGSLLEGGRVSPWKLAGTVLRHPGIVPELWRIARATRLAADNLARALGEVLTLTLPFGMDL